MPCINVEQFKRKIKEGETLQKGTGLKKQFVLSEIKGIEETTDGLKVPFIISTSSVDRDNDTISMDGWRLDNFKKNPVVLWAHSNKEPPVGAAENTRIENGELKSITIFTPKDLNPFGYMIGEMYKRGFLRAVSVGFDPVKYAWVEDESRPWGIDYMEQELLEYSCCPVPANPEALIDAKSKGIDLDPMVDWVIRVLDDGIMIPRHKAEHIYSILNKKSTFVIPKQPEMVPNEPIKDNGLILLEKQIQTNLNWR